MHRLAGGPDLSDLTPRTPRGKQRTRIAAPEELKRLFAHASPAMRYCLICWAQMAMRFTESLIPTPQKYNKENQTLETTVKGRQTRLDPVPNELAKILQSLEPISADEMDNLSIRYYTSDTARRWTSKNSKKSALELVRAARPRSGPE
jgi:hypothetical protein